MKSVTTIIVKVELRHHSELLTEQEVHIALTPDEPIHAGKLLDACQRSVSHCIDALQKDLDITQ